MTAETISTSGVAARRATRDATLAIGAPFALYLAGVALLGDWLVDDAGISLAYARNLASGHGLVDQPGHAPVEGFSNPTWVLLLAPLTRLPGFDPVVFTKLLGALAVLGAMLLVRRTVRVAGGTEPAALAANLLLATCPPVVIWTASGLENGLSLVLGAAMAAALVLRPRGWATRGGLLAGAMAATHPESILYAAVGWLVVGLDRELPWRERARAAGRWTLGFAAFVVPLFALRLAVFGRPLPQTWYAKRVAATPWARLVDVAGHPGDTLGRAAELARGVAGPIGPWLLLAAVVAAAWLATRRALGRGAGVALALLAVSVGAFVVLDDDWMGELRFGTVPALAAALLLALLGERALRRAPRAVARLAPPIAALAIGAAAAPRLVRFAASPPTPMADVDRELGQRVERWARSLGLPRASVLAADVGALLWASSLEVRDAAGLCEPAVTRTLKNDGPVWLWEHPAFYAWVFETAKPTFVATNAFWSAVTWLEKDPRFVRDYAPVEAYVDRWAQATYGRRVHSGIWVRRDALGAEDAVAKLRAARSAPRPVPLAWQLVDAWRGPQSDAELRDEARAIVARDPNRAAELWKRVLGAAPDDVEALEPRARALDEARRYDEARDVWTRILELAARAGDARLEADARERLEGADLETRVAAWMNAGVETALVRHDWTAAIPLFRRVLAEQPDHYGATFQLARALAMTGRDDEARPVWQRVVWMAERWNDPDTAALARARLAPP